MTTAAFLLVLASAGVGLVVLGLKDYRVPYTQGLGAFTALQERDIASRLLVFPEENHWVLNGANSIRWHDEVEAWMDRWTDPANWKGNRIPNTKEPEWAQYRFEKARRISGVEVYWFENGGDRKLPESWRVFYRHAGEWRPVAALGDYPLETDRFNEVKFTAVETDSLRLEVDLQPGVSAGIQEWRVIP